MDDWRIIPGFSTYQCNPVGDVVSLVGRHRYRAGRQVLRHIREGKWFSYVVNDAGHRLPVAVRRLVMLAFCGPQPPGQRIYHRDGNLFNHRLDNLYYGALKTLLPKEPAAHTGRPPKLSAGDVSEIRRRCGTKEKRRQIAREFGIDPSLVTYIAQGKRYQSVGKA